MLFFFFSSSLDKVVKLFVGGHVINGAYPVRVILISYLVKGAKVISTLFWFQNCFCFRDRTFFSHVAPFWNLYCGFQLETSQKFIKKTLSDGHSSNLISLYNSNGAKVSIVKWSQIWISLPEVLFLIEPIFRKYIKNGNSWQFWKCQIWNFWQWKSKSETTLQ